MNPSEKKRAIIRAIFYGIVNRQNNYRAVPLTQAEIHRLNIDLIELYRPGMNDAAMARSFRTIENLQKQIDEKTETHRNETKKTKTSAARR